MSATNRDPQKPDDSHRLFFALELQPEVRDAVVDIASRIQKAATFTAIKAAWVPEDNLHLTLYFLGAVEKDKALRLRELISGNPPRIAPFRLDVRRIGLFPVAKRVPPKVLWIGIHNPPPQLLGLRAYIAAMLKKCGIPVPDDGEYIPHITLARFKSTKGMGALKDQLYTYEFAKAGKSDTDTLTLMESFTGGGPARYGPFASVPFAPEETAAPPKEE